MTIESMASMLGGPKVLHRQVRTASDLVDLTRAGLPVDILFELAESLLMDRKAVAQAIGIAERTLSRRLNSQGRLSSTESDRAMRLVRIFAQAIWTLGDQAKASRWLQTPNRVLQGKTPLELMDTDAGTQSIETVLGRIAYGIYS